MGRSGWMFLLRTSFVSVLDVVGVSRDALYS